MKSRSRRSSDFTYSVSSLLSLAALPRGAPGSLARGARAIDGPATLSRVRIDEFAASLPGTRAASGTAGPTRFLLWLSGLAGILFGVNVAPRVDCGGFWGRGCAGAARLTRWRLSWDERQPAQRIAGTRFLSKPR